MPSVSVVVASHASREQLDACLASLAPQCTAGSAELVVARGASDDFVEELRSTRPEATFVAAPSGATPKELRRLGFDASRGDIVALTDDETVPDADWIATLFARSSRA